MHDSHQSTVVDSDDRVSTDGLTTDRLTTARVVVEHIRPDVDGGRFPAKRTVGDLVEVRADIFADGHDVVLAVLRHRNVGADLRVGPAAAGGHIGPPLQTPAWCESPMTLLVQGTDEWSGQFRVEALGWHEYEIVSWVDRFRTWRRDLEIKHAAGQDVALEL